MFFTCIGLTHLIEDQQFDQANQDNKASEFSSGQLFKSTTIPNPDFKSITEFLCLKHMLTVSVLP